MIALPSTNTKARLRNSLLMIFVFMLFIFFLGLAFFDFSSLSTHFWPFTHVMRKIRREVTRKMQRACKPRIARISQMTSLRRARRSRPPYPGYWSDPWLNLFRRHQGDASFEAGIAAQGIPRNLAIQVGCSSAVRIFSSVERTEASFNGC